MAVQVIRVKVVVEGLEDKLYRVIDISDTKTLAQLAYTILVSFDTLRYHFFMIEYKGVQYSTTKMINPKFKLAQRKKLKDLKLEINDQIKMIYDFGLEKHFLIEILEFKDMPRGHGTKYPYIIDGQGRGIIDDLSIEELVQIIDKTDKFNKATTIYPMNYEMEYAHNLVYDYHNYNIDIDNALLKIDVEITKNNYESK